VRFAARSVSGAARLGKRMGEARGGQSEHALLLGAAWMDPETLYRQLGRLIETRLISPRTET
jgi:hypothetical protein